METKSDGYSVVIFYPNYQTIENGYLCGEVETDVLLKTKNYFIHEVYTDLNNVSCDVIGVVGKLVITKKQKNVCNWLKLGIDNKVPLVMEVISNQHLVPERDCLIIMYNKPCFMKSELFMGPNSDNIDEDHFKQLICSLKKTSVTRSVCDNKNQSIPSLIINILLVTLTICFTGLDRLLPRLNIVLKFSTLASHISAFIKCAVNELQSVGLQSSNTHRTLKTRNYIFGILGDWLGGLLLIYWMLSYVSINDMLKMLPVQSEVLVESLKDMVHYLMGSPADLKLNGPLNNVLGNFFLFHIDLWWAFLGFSRPLLEFGFHMFICLGSLGLSFQLAILADILAVASLHVYIIYVYAARLYNLQVTGLSSLSRVFFGMKRNPLPGRVDSCPYSTEQLLIGTIAFTVLLFLLPTTLVYYIVFTAIRLVIMSIEGLLNRARFVLRAVPLYTSFLWLFNSPVTTSCVRLTPRMGHQLVVLEATLVQRPWWPTVQACMPPLPPPVQWGDLCWHLLTGQLIYPV